MYTRNGISLVDHTDSVIIEGTRKIDNVFFVSSPQIIDEFLSKSMRNIPMENMRVKVIVVPDIIANNIYVEKMREMIDVHSENILKNNEKFVFASWKIKKVMGMSIVFLATSGKSNLLELKGLIDNEDVKKNMIDVSFESIKALSESKSFDIFDIA